MSYFNRFRSHNSSDDFNLFMTFLQDSLVNPKRILQNLEEVFSQYYMHSDMPRSSTKHYCVNRHEIIVGLKRTKATLCAMIVLKVFKLV